MIGRRGENFTAAQPLDVVQVAAVARVAALHAGKHGTGGALDGARAVERHGDVHIHALAPRAIERVRRAAARHRIQIVQRVAATAAVEAAHVAAVGAQRPAGVVEGLLDVQLNAVVGALDSLEGQHQRTARRPLEIQEAIGVAAACEPSHCHRSQRSIHPGGLARRPALRVERKPPVRIEVLRRDVHLFQLVAAVPQDVAAAERLDVRQRSRLGEPDEAAVEAHEGLPLRASDGAGVTEALVASEEGRGHVDVLAAPEAA